MGGIYLSADANLLYYNVDKLSFSKFDSRFLQQFSFPDTRDYSSQSYRMMSVTRTFDSRAETKESAMAEVSKDGYEDDNGSEVKIYCSCYQER